MTAFPPQGLPATATLPVSIVIKSADSPDNKRADVQCMGHADELMINPALAALSSQGGGIAFLHGHNYYVTGPIILPKNVILRGLGIDVTRIHLEDNANDDVVQTDGFDTLTGTGDHTTVISRFGLSNLTVDGNKAHQTSGSGVRIYGYHLVLENLLIEQCHDDGLYTEWSDWGADPSGEGMEAFISNLYIRDNGGVGWINRGPHDSYITNIVAYHNQTGISFEQSVGFYSGASDVVLNVHSYSNVGDNLILNAVVNATNIVAESSATGRGIAIRQGDCHLYNVAVYNNPIGIEIGYTGFTVLGTILQGRVAAAAGQTAFKLTNEASSMVQASGWVTGTLILGTWDTASAYWIMNTATHTLIHNP